MTFLNAIKTPCEEILALEVSRFHLQHCWGCIIAAEP